MSKNAALWADFLADGDGPLEVIGQDAGLSQFFCETCDKDLKSEEMRKQHFSEHIPCAYPGCKFEAHFLVSLIIFYFLNLSLRSLKNTFEWHMVTALVQSVWKPRKTFESGARSGEKIIRPGQKSMRRKKVCIYSKKIFENKK